MIFSRRNRRVIKSIRILTAEFFKKQEKKRESKLINRSNNKREFVVSFILTGNMMASNFNKLSSLLLINELPL